MGEKYTLSENKNIDGGKIYTELEKNTGGKILGEKYTASDKKKYLKKFRGKKIYTE